MKKLSHTLQKKKLLSIYFTAGYPQLTSTEEIISGLSKAGVDIIEVGIPFSDPVADGFTIQQSNYVAIKNGITLPMILKQLNEVDTSVTPPIVLMSYFNPIMQYGIKNFIADCQQVGVEGVIIPDLPPELYIENYQADFTKTGISFIPIATPLTLTHRLQTILQAADSYIYLVSSSSTTGSEIDKKENVLSEFCLTYNQIKNQKPFLIGFGIKTKIDFDYVCQYGSGGIIGSEFIRQLFSTKHIATICTTFVQRFK